MLKLVRKAMIALAVCATAVACGSLPPPPKDLGDPDSLSAAPDYVIGPLDQIQVHVQGVPELSVTVPVRPDGKVSIPLVEDMPAAGKSPGALARDIETELRPYVQEPTVSVVVQQFADTSPYTVRVIGAVTNPRPVAYHPRMTVLDVMVAVGGLGEFAAGNDATLIRGRGENEQVYRLRLEDLLVDADVSENAPVQPGDVIVVPESLF